MNLARREATMVTMTALAVGFGAACDNAALDPASADDVGQVQIALTQVPTDASCIRLSAAAMTRTVTKQVNLMPGAASFTTTFGGLPLGPVNIWGDVFSVACSSVTRRRSPPGSAIRCA